MILLDFNKSAIDFDGKEYIVNLGKWLANHIASSSELEPVKFVDIAKSLYETGKVQVDKADLNKIKTFIENNRSIPIIAKVEFFKLIEECQKCLTN